MVFEQLSKLCRDSAFFKSYAAASLVVFKDTVQVLIALKHDTLTTGIAVLGGQSTVEASLTGMCPGNVASPNS